MTAKKKGTRKKAATVTVEGPPSLRRLMNRKVNGGKPIVFKDGRADVSSEVAKELTAEYETLTIYKE